MLDLGRLRDVVIHPEDMLAEAWAGAVLGDVNAALRPHGLILGHDPWSVGIAAAGGAFSTDGVGYMGGRWGSNAIAERATRTPAAARVRAASIDTA